MTGVLGHLADFGCIAGGRGAPSGRRSGEEVGGGSLGILDERFELVDFAKAFPDVPRNFV